MSAVFMNDPWLHQPIFSHQNIGDRHQSYFFLSFYGWFYEFYLFLSLNPNSTIIVNVVGNCLVRLLFCSNSLYYIWKNIPESKQHKQALLTLKKSLLWIILKSSQEPRVQQHSSVSLFVFQQTMFGCWVQSDDCNRRGKSRRNAVRPLCLSYSLILLTLSLCCVRQDKHAGHSYPSSWCPTREFPCVSIRDFQPMPSLVHFSV